jgi:hypothetical protein
MKVKRTRVNRALGLWGMMFVLTVLSVGLPTRFTWPYWLYGLIWGIATAAVHYVFRGFFEEEIEV